MDQAGAGFRGYDPVEDGEQILRIILNAFNARLASYASAHPSVAYVDLRGPLSDERLWHDELHLYGDGWEVAGGAFYSELQGLGVVA